MTSESLGLAAPLARLRSCFGLGGIRIACALLALSVGVGEARGDARAQMVRALKKKASPITFGAPTSDPPVVGAGHLANYSAATLFTLDRAGRFIALSFYSPSTVPAARVRGIVYSSGKALVGATSELVGIAPGWNTVSFAAPLDLDPGDYFLGLNANAGFDWGRLATSGYTTFFWADSYADGPLANFVGTASATGWAVYLTGTAR